MGEAFARTLYPLKITGMHFSQARTRIVSDDASQLKAFDITASFWCAELGMGYCSSTGAGKILEGVTGQQQAVTIVSFEDITSFFP